MNASSPKAGRRKLPGVHILVATPFRRVSFRILLIILASICSAFLLRKSIFGDIGGLAAFLIAAGVSWLCGPAVATLGPIIILHIDRWQRMGDSAFTTWYTTQELTNWLFATVVMATIGWAGNLTRKSLRELRQSEALLREQAHHKDQFLATLAHELRNPLSPLLSAVELLQATPEEPLDSDQQHELHQTMRRQIEHLLHLVDDLLDINRINAGKIKLRTERTSLQEVVRDGVEAVKIQVAAARHQLGLAMPDEQIFIHGDRTRLVQVIVNLLNNATKFTPTGGGIHMDVSTDGKFAIVEVKDTGVGIAPDALPRVFEMFAQIENKLSRENRGLGIGLSLSRRLVEMHGGNIEAHSDGVGSGSRFVVRLPCTPSNDRLTH